MATAPTTIKTIALTGQTEFDIPFEYLARKFVKVTLLGADRKVLVLNTDYRFATNTKISLLTDPGAYTFIELRRVTSASERIVNFYDGSVLRAGDMNASNVQTIHIAEEARDVALYTLGIDDDGELDARNRRIRNLRAGIEPNDAVNVAQVAALLTPDDGNGNQSMVWNRRVVTYPLETVFARYSDDGRSVTPRLRVGDSHYLPTFILQDSITLTGEILDYRDGTIGINTSAGLKIFSRINAEAVSIDSLPFVTPEQFGYRVGFGTDAFENAAVHAKKSGKYILLGATEYKLTTANMQGVEVRGVQGSSVNGYFKNPGKLSGFRYGDTVTGQTDLQSPRIFQLPPSNVDNKFVVQMAYSDKVQLVCTQNDGMEKYDTGIIMRSANGADNSPWEHIRSQQIYRGIAYALQGFDGLVTSGTVEDFNATPVQAGFVGGDWKGNFSSENTYLKCKRMTTTGSYIQRTIEVDDTGHINVGFHTSTSGSAFSISVDGSERATGTTRADVRRPRFRTLKVYVGFQPSAVVRVTHTGNDAQLLTITGFNVHRPAESRPELNYELYAFYYDLLATYSANIGAHDYALRIPGIGFAGSYHGGEVALMTPVWRVDGEAVTLQPSKPRAGRIVDLSEKTRIHSVIDATIYQRFDGNSRHTLALQLEGTNGVPFDTDRMYIGMNGTYDAFSRVLYPVMAEGVSGAATPDFLCGLTNMVAQENPNTGQVVYTHCNIPEGLPSGKGGVFIKTLDEVGSNYQKVYFAWVYDSPMKIDKISAQIVKVFC